MTPRQLLGQARVHTFEYVPYLASYIYSLREHETPGIGTAAVDEAGNLYWCPQFISSVPKETCAYLIAHEVLHMIFEHHARAREIYGEHPSEQQKFVMNVAADLVIEQTLAIMRQHRPDGAVYLGAKVPQLGGMRLNFPENRSMPEYYRLIMEKLKKQSGSDNNQQQQQGASDDSGNDSDSPDDSSPPSGDGTADGAGQDDGSDDGTQADGSESASDDGAGSPSSGPGKAPQQPGAPGSGGSCADGCRREYEVESDGSWENWGEDMAAARTEKAIEEYEASHPGKVPGNIKEALNAKLRPQPDPFDQLRSAVCTSVASPVGGRDYSHRRLSKKQPPGDDAPLLHGRITVLPHAVVIVDTSASMMRKDIQARALAVVAQGLRKLGRVRVYCADTHVRSNQLVASTKRFEWAGGGGTSMARALEQVDREEHPDSIILITDAETGWPAKKTHARVVVAYTGKPGSHYHREIPSWCKTVTLAKED